MSVNQLTEFVKSSIHDKTTNDREIAQFLLTSVKLKQKLEASTVEDLQGEGAGPKTVAALKKLMETSAGFSAPVATAKAAAPPTYEQSHPPPEYNEQYRIINEARDYALNYTQSLPNFLCLQITRRYYDRHYQEGTEGSWAQADVLKAKLSYFNQKEDYKLLGVNDEAAIDKNYDSVGGSISRGEFGSLMKEVFDLSSQTEFHWLRWGNLDSKVCHVYKYKVEQEHSRWTVDFQHTEQVTPAYEGLVYIDKQKNTVLRITLDALMPPTFPIQEVHSRLDYRTTNVGGQPFLLPLYSEVKMRHDHMGTKNVIEFSGYRRYSADTSITFSDAGDDTDIKDDGKPDKQATPVKPPQP